MSDAPDDPTFESADAGASACFPMQAGNVKKGAHAMLKGHPCKVMEVSTSKTGKHGHAKAHIVGIDIFTNKKYEDLCPTSHNMEIPFVNRAEYQIVDISDDGFVTMMTEGGETKSDLTLPTDTEGNEDEMAKQIREMFASDKQILVGVLSACGTEKIIAAKELGS